MTTTSDLVESITQMEEELIRLQRVEWKYNDLLKKSKELLEREQELSELEADLAKQQHILDKVDSLMHFAEQMLGHLTINLNEIKRTLGK